MVNGKEVERRAGSRLMMTDSQKATDRKKQGYRLGLVQDTCQVRSDEMMYWLMNVFLQDLEERKLCTPDFWPATVGVSITSCFYKKILTDTWRE